MSLPCCVLLCLYSCQWRRHGLKCGYAESEYEAQMAKSRGGGSWRRGCELRPTSQGIEFGAFWDVDIASKWWTVKMMVFVINDIVWRSTHRLNQYENETATITSCLSRFMRVTKCDQCQLCSEVCSLKFLGARFNDEVLCDEDIKTRLALARERMRKLDPHGEAGL